MRTIRIQTPENVDFVFELAGLGSRFVAVFIDHVLAMALTLLLFYILSQLALLSQSLAMVLMTLTGFLVLQCYFILLEWRWSGRTLGKQIVGIQVIQESGLPIAFHQALVRNVVRVLDFMPAPGYGFGGLVALLHPQGKRLGDLAAKTIVVRVARAVRPAEVCTPRDRYNSLVQDLAMRRVIRTRISREEKNLLVEVCLRRDEMAPEARLDIFEELSRLVQSRIGIQKEEFLSDEKLVQNAASVLLEEGKPEEWGLLQLPGVPRTAEHRTTRRSRSRLPGVRRTPAS